MQENRLLGRLILILQDSYAILYDKILTTIRDDAREVNDGLN